MLQYSDLHLSRPLNNKFNLFYEWQGYYKLEMKTTVRVNQLSEPGFSGNIGKRPTKLSRLACIFKIWLRCSDPVKNAKRKEIQ